MAAGWKIRQDGIAFMRIIFGGIFALAIMLALPVPAGAQSAPSPALPFTWATWPVSSAPARFKFQLDDGSKPALLATVNLFLPDPRWASMPIRIFSDTGVPVTSDVLWTAPGEPTTVLFSTVPDAKYYCAYVGSNWPLLPLENTRAGVLLESREGDGKPIDNLSQMSQAWNQSSKVLGRAMVPGIWEGENRFRVDVNLLEHLQGWFDVANPEHLDLAIISNDSTFVLIDGKEVAAWPGHHDFNWAQVPPHQGGVDLQPGVHLLEYYNAYCDTGADRRFPLCCLAVKGGPFADWTGLRPDVEFFRPIAHAHVVYYEGRSDAVPALAAQAPPFTLERVTLGQCVIDPHIADIGLISVQLTAYPLKGTMTWTFDDGSTATGEQVTHLFLRPGMRVIQLSAKDGAHDLGTVRETINVHPDWTMLTALPELTPAYRAEIMGRDPATLSVSDLAGCVAVGEGYQDTELLLKLLPQVCAKIKAISDADLPYVTDAAVFLANDWTHSTEAIQLLHVLVDRCTQDNSSPQLTTLANRTRLTLARLTLTNSDRTDEVRSLVDAIDARTLTGSDSRQLAMLRADLALATSDVLGAKKQYENLTGAPSGPDARSSVRRTGQIGAARAFLERKDFAAAEQSLHEVAGAAPIEKMSRPIGSLTRLRLYQDENRPQAACISGPNACCPS